MGLTFIFYISALSGFDYMALAAGLFTKVAENSLYQKIANFDNFLCHNVYFETIRNFLIGMMICLCHSLDTAVL